MSVTQDLIKLSPDSKARLRNRLRNLLMKFPDTHSLVITFAPDVSEALECRDFRITVLIEKKEDAKRSKYLFKEYGFHFEENYLKHVDMGYLRKEVLPSPSEAEILSMRYKRVTKKLRQDYLQFLYRNLNHFKGTDSTDLYPLITTLNSLVIQTEAPRFHHLYVTSLNTNGYLVYNRDMKPYYSIP